jgi:hypothetical protein
MCDAMYERHHDSRRYSTNTQYKHMMQYICTKIYTANTNDHDIYTIFARYKHLIVHPSVCGLVVVSTVRQRISLLKMRVLLQGSKNLLEYSKFCYDARIVICDGLHVGVGWRG